MKRYDWQASSKIDAGFYGRAGGAPKDTLLLNQVHGNKCVRVTQPWDSKTPPDADAMVSDIRGLTLGIKTADCAPVLFVADGIIGAAHAGWRGALEGVLEATVEAMNTPPSQISACIGPCIDKKSYEVDVVFFQKFIEKSESYKDFFSLPYKESHYMFDLAGFCASRLYDAGLNDVIIVGMDTYSNAENFYSYRRDTHHEVINTARNISTIMLR